LMSQSVEGGKPVRFSLSAGTRVLPSALFAFVIGAGEGRNATAVPYRGGVFRAAAGCVHAVVLYKAFYEAEISRLNANCHRIVTLCCWGAAVPTLDIRASRNPFREGFVENLQQRWRCEQATGQAPIPLATPSPHRAAPPRPSTPDPNDRHTPPHTAPQNPLDPPSITMPTIPPNQPNHG
jgi:hypothetical protein